MWPLLGPKAHFISWINDCRYRRRLPVNAWYKQCSDTLSVPILVIQNDLIEPVQSSYSAISLTTCDLDNLECAA